MAKLFKYFKELLFYGCIALIPIGLLFRFNDWIGGPSFLAIGLLGVAIYFLVRVIKSFGNEHFDKLSMFLQALIFLMSITLFAKYLNHTFWNIPALIIIPLFALSSLFFIIKIKKKELKITLTLVLYLLLLIPIFFVRTHNGPLHYSMEVSYGRYDPSRYVSVKLPYEFKYDRTERLCNRTLRLGKIGQLDEAIEILNEARNLEPDNPEVLFHQSNFYARNDSLEKAILLLDTAIKIDRLQWAGLFNNRGLLYFKLSENGKAMEDYKKAITLDPKNPIFYANLALVFYL